MIRVGFWLRVSTNDQNTETQRYLATQYCDKTFPNGWKLTKEYNLEGISAYKDTNEIGGLGSYRREVIKDSKQAVWDHLIVQDLSRIARDGVVGGVTFLSALRESGAEVHIIQSPYLNDPNMPLKDGISAMFFEMATLDSKIRGQKSKEAQQLAKEKGIHIGRPKGSGDSKPRRRRTNVEIRNGY